MSDQKVHIIGGGTYFHVRPHFSLCAKAYGQTAKQLAQLFGNYRFKNGEGPKPVLHLTQMADPASKLETNADIEKLVDTLIADPTTKMIVMTAALCDWDVQGIGGFNDNVGMDMPRLKTRENGVFKDRTLKLSPSAKIIEKIRRERKDIFLIGFKTTAGETEDAQFFAGLRLLKDASCNLVIANDIRTRKNMVITPEEARYVQKESVCNPPAPAHESRWTFLDDLVEMAVKRSQLHFTRSTVVEGPLVAWDSPKIPASLRTVVNHCIDRGAYKAFNGKTVGHFAVKAEGDQFITSIRKSNFNNLADVGMVLVTADDRDHVIAHGAKPSVGGQSQRIIFNEHPDVDCIVHFHCPERKPGTVNGKRQKFLECGSHECGQNTSNGLESYGALKAVMLEKHGPNIVFNRNMDPNTVIEFIETHWDLERSTRE
jgi:hypothetical protein